MVMQKGFNANFGNNLYDGRNNHSSVDNSSINNIQQAIKNNTLIQAIVVDTLHDPNLLNKQKCKIIFDELDEFNQSKFASKHQDNKTYLVNLPRNSIIIKPIEEANDLLKNKIAYPFFSSHFLIPVKNGEVVWCFKFGNEFYWLTRIHGNNSSEDVNYSHHNRSIYESSEVPNFSNFYGAGDRNFTLETKNPDDRGIAFEQILNNSINKNVIMEPVPRITARPGDTIIQGSNNTAILLTTNRGYDSKNRPEVQKNSNSLLENSASFIEKGAIDIVVGRGRPTKNKNSDEKKSTRPKTIKNTRNFFETNKNSILYKNENQSKVDYVANSDEDFIGNHSINKLEGDPDFIDDSARVYVSMNMNVDDTLDLKKFYPNKVIKPGKDNSGIDLPESKESSTVMLRADEIRIVARKDDERSINGSIKIVKEGIRDDINGNGSAVIMIQPNGTIIIDGPKILIGGEKLIGNNGEGNQVSIGLGATEPLVLGNTLKILLEQFMDQTMQALENHQHTGGSGPVNPAGSPNEPTYAVALKPHIDKMKETRNQLSNFLSKLGKTQ